MQHHQNGGLSEALDRLSRLVFTEQTLTTTLDRSAQLAVGGISGADMAGIALDVDGYIYTGGASEDLVTEIDSYQYATDRGPCLEAVRTGRVVSLPSTSSDRRWPRFSEKAAAKGIGSVLSSPLVSDGAVIGSLNLYAYAPDSFAESDEEAVVHFARAASTLLANANFVYSIVDQKRRLEEALEECDLIGKATGVLMERFHVTREAADVSLRRDSGRQGKGLRQFAGEILDSVATTGA